METTVIPNVAYWMSAMCNVTCIADSSVFFLISQVLTLIVFWFSDFIDHMTSGSRLAKQCSYDAKYFAGIDECVPLSIAGTSDFLNAYTRVNTCPGGHVSSLSDLEGLRFCNIINGDLIINVNDVNADYTSLFDISTIQGLMQFPLEY